MNIMTFYLSRLLNNRVYRQDMSSVGRLRDFVVDATAMRPKVIAIQVRSGQEIFFIRFDAVSIEKVNAQYQITCNDVSKVSVPTEGTFMLRKHVLDKQLIDINGRKLVRVNDVRLATLSAGTFVVAVDVGFEGLLRRLGVAKPAKRVLQRLDVSIPSNLLLWDEIETVHFGQRDIQLSKDLTKLSTMHPSDLADILEDLDGKSQLDMFTSLDEETKLDVLEEMESAAQVAVLEQMTVSEAASILEKLPSDEAADILDELETDRASEILHAMQPESSDAIQTLLDYDEDAVGSVMTTDHLSFFESVTAEDVISSLRQAKPEADRVYYLYVIDRSNRLLGTVSLRDLIIANPEDQLGVFTNRNVIYVQDVDDTEVLFDIVDKYNLLAVPVVNEQRQLIGVVTVNDVIHTLKKNRKGRF